MRMWDLALGIFIFNFVLTMLVGLTDTEGNDIFSSAGIYAPLKTNEWRRGTFNETISQMNPQAGDVGLIEGALNLVTFLVNAFLIAVNVIFQSTLGFPAMLHSGFGIPSLITNVIMGIMVLVYVMGFLEFISGRQTGA